MSVLPHPVLYLCRSWGKFFLLTSVIKELLCKREKGKLEFESRLVMLSSQVTSDITKFFKAFVSLSEKTEYSTAFLVEGEY